MKYQRFCLNKGVKKFLKFHIMLVHQKRINLLITAITRSRLLTYANSHTAMTPLQGGLHRSSKGGIFQLKEVEASERRLSSFLTGVVL